MHGEEIHPGDLVAGKYRVRTILGRKVGLLVEAFHTEFDQRVVIKILPSGHGDPKEIERFRREARTLGKLESEHVARIIDVGSQPDGGFYLVRQYIEGVDLGTYLKNHGARPLEEAVMFVLQVSEAVAETHAHNIVLRELNPGHVFVTHRAGGAPLLKITDFGTAKLMKDVSAPAGGNSLTATALFGLSPYASPELVRKAKNVDVRADVWSLGAILYALLTGRPPFESDLATMMLMIAKEEPVPLGALRPDLPGELEQIVRWCMAKDVDGRFGSVYALAHALLPYAPPEGVVLIDRIGQVLNASKSGRHAAAPVPSGAALPPPRTPPRSGHPPPAGATTTTGRPLPPARPPSGPPSSAAPRALPPISAPPSRPGVTSGAMMGSGPPRPASAPPSHPSQPHPSQPHAAQPHAAQPHPSTPISRPAAAPPSSRPPLARARGRTNDDSVTQILSLDANDPNSPAFNPYAAAVPKPAKPPSEIGPAVPSGAPSSSRPAPTLMSGASPMQNRLPEKTPRIATPAPTGLGALANRLASAPPSSYGSRRPDSVPASALQVASATGPHPALLARPTKTSGDRKMLLGALAALAVLLPVVLVLLLRGPDVTPRPMAQVPGGAKAGAGKDPGTSTDTSTPAGSAAGQSADPTAPLAANDTPPGTTVAPADLPGNPPPKQLPPPTSFGKNNPPPPPPPDKSTPPPPPPAGGGNDPGTLLAIATGGSCQFMVNGASKGTSSTLRVNLKPGKYSVTCKPSSGATKSRSVQIRPGETSMLTFKL